jgi:hypothetical protein
MPEHSTPTGAVFLSYASQDAEAAARICESLRAAGIEVWFDRSDLRGGDSWDAHIKKQIHECALFIPVISAQTNARAEGYFRREWKLATRRLMDLADDAAFLVPVVIDETREADARVPEEFLNAQWTRLPAAQHRLRMRNGCDSCLARLISVASSHFAEVRSRGPWTGSSAAGRRIALDARGGRADRTPAGPGRWSLLVLPAYA